MTLLREVTEGEDSPITPDDGWNVGHLAHMGMLLSCEGFSLRLDLHNLNMLFDFAEIGEVGDIKDHDGRIIQVEPRDDGIVLKRQDDETYPNGVVLDLDTLNEMGIEQHENTDDQPDSDYESIDGDDTINSDQYDDLNEGLKRAYRRIGKRIKPGFRITSGFRKGHVVATAAGAFKPRIKAATRLKLQTAERRHRIVRILKSKKTRKLPISKRLATMNQRIK